ncbi:MAG: T9SS type A sorting domain-containing protein [Saprospiraceae bacterium]
MKKIYLLFLLLVFIFSKNIFGQIEPRLTEKIKEVYDQNEYRKDYHQFITYQENGDTLSVIKKSYDSDGKLLSWIGDFFSYDSENRLFKKNNKRYNWELDLWISNYWKDFFYDENGCIEREELTYNVGGFQGVWYYRTDENCKRQEARRTDFGSPLERYNLYIYPDENNSLIITKHEFIQNVWKEVEQDKWIRNERGDLTQRVRFFRNDFSPPDDTAFFSIREYEYYYRDDFYTGQLNAKFQKYFSNVANIFSPPFNLITYQFENQYDYKYYCDGLVAKETLSIVGDSKPLSRILYFYEGKNDCFDSEQNLEILLSPNPSFGEIEIKSLIFESGDTELQIFSPSGQLVFEKSIASRSHYQNLDLNGLNNGLYVIHLRSGKHFSTSNVVIAK